MPLSQLLRSHLESLIANETGVMDSIRSVHPVSGGDINAAYRLDGNDSRYFLKVNDAPLFPDIFEREATGLETLGNVTPGVLTHGEFGKEIFLLIPWIEVGVKSALGHQNLGRMLAGVHQRTSDNFGLEYDNYIGTLPQINMQCRTWATFFIEHRLLYQIELANSKGFISSKLGNDFEILFNRFDELYPIESPSLLHGDLWSGNYLISSDSKPFLIDPAIYYGHREMDIAMTKLFGGFSADFYTAYHEQFPLQRGWQQRVSLWNLYPLLVHVNMFGTSYLPELKDCLAKWL